MFERFTDRSRKVMQLATQEAQRFGHEYVGTEHVLLGLLKEGAGVGANVLMRLGVDLRSIRVEVEKIVLPANQSVHVVMGRLPLTPRTKRVIDFAVEEARYLNHNYVGTEHLLLGLIREEEGVGALVLTGLGIKLEAVREEVLQLLGKATPIERAKVASRREELAAVVEKLSDAEVRMLLVDAVLVASDPPERDRILAGTVPREVVEGWMKLSRLEEEATAPKESQIVSG